MTLSEALQARQRTRPYLTRGAWLQAVTDGAYESCFIQATNTPAGCILYDNLTDRTRRWIPTEADLLADDWQTCNGNCCHLTITDVNGITHYEGAYP